jgi:serine/threonine protein kinase
MPAQPLEPGFRLDKYEVIRHIASGGMGAVYQARDLDLGRIVALKVLPAELASARPQVVERFRREARHAARLSHKNIVTLYAWGQDQNLYYLALEFVEGIDLSAYIQRKGQLTPEESRRILIHAVKALEHAHAHGVIHRDIKPSNFLLSNQRGRSSVKLTDFGLARVDNDDDYRVTRAGSTVGTLDYMSPEQARDSFATDIRSDIYSLGCTAYHMLAGRPPFAEGGLGERLYKHLEVPPPDIRDFNPNVSQGLWEVLQRMLAKRPEDRYQTPTELLTVLRKIHAEVSAEQAAAAAPSSAEAVPPPSSSSEQIVTSESSEPEAPESPEPPAPAADAAPEDAAPTVADASSLSISAEQVKAAAGQYQRARQVLVEGGNEDYARQLLLACLKLDPSHLHARKVLRQISQKGGGSFLGRWVGSLSNLANRGKVKAARASGDHRKVLEYGEDVLARRPDDVSAVLDMAASAQALALTDLAVWLLEQGRDQSPDNTALARALALLYEERGQLKQAIALWEKVSKAEPDDHEAKRKINALAVNDHISKARYRR